MKKMCILCLGLGISNSFSMEQINQMDNPLKPSVSNELTQPIQGSIPPAMLDGLTDSNISTPETLQETEEYRRLREQNEDLQRQLTTLQTQYDLNQRFNDTYDTTNAIFRDILSDVRKLKSQQEESTRVLAVLQKSSKVKNLTGMVISLSAKVDDMEQSIDSKLKQLNSSSVRTSIKNLSQQMKVQNQEMRKLSEQINDLLLRQMKTKDKTKILRIQTKNLSDQITDLSVKQRNTESQIMVFSQITDELEHEAETLQMNFSKMHSTAQPKTEEIEELRREIDLLQMNFDMMRKMLQQSENPLFKDSSDDNIHLIDPIDRFSSNSENDIDPNDKSVSDEGI